MSEREHERGEGQREKQTPQGARSPMRDSILEVRDHDLSQRQSLNQLSHPGAHKGILLSHIPSFTLSTPIYPWPQGTSDFAGPQ